jgi:putative tricarboxylic transport membrane protein
MDLLTGLIGIFQPMNLFYCFLGCLLGTLVGVLPGLGPVSALSILLPVTMYLDPTGSIIMLGGIYYGAQYGGSTTSILVNVPGEVTSIATTFDGYAMTKQGRAGQALWIAAVGSFIAGTLGCIVVSLVGPGIAKYAVKFGPAENAGLLFFALTTLVSLSGGSIAKGFITGIGGLVLSSVGPDPMSAINRFTFGSTSLSRGLEIVPIIVGLFGIAEMLSSAEEGIGKIYEGTLGKMMPRGKELARGLWASLRGTLLGLPLGFFPGVSGAMVTFLAYDIEKKISKTPEKFGKGAIEGVATVEASNNAVSQTNFIPLLSLGIPVGPSMAIILATLMIHGLQPGPMLFIQQKQFVWTVIASMYIGNVMLLVLNLPLVGLWARISTIPYKYLAPVILGLCVVGAYSGRSTMMDVWIALAAGVLGYFMKKSHWPIAPLALGFVLGPMLELSIRQSIAAGGPTIFFTRPVALVFILIALAVCLFPLVMKKKQVPVSDED